MFDTDCFLFSMTQESLSLREFYIASALGILKESNTRKKLYS